MRLVAGVLLAALAVAGCDEAPQVDAGPKWLQPGQSKTSTARLWKQEKSIAAEGRMSCLVSGTQADEFLSAVGKDGLIYRIDVSLDPKPYDDAHRRQIARCEADNKGPTPRAERNCRADPQFRVRFDISGDDVGPIKPAHGSGDVPVEAVSMTGEMPNPIMVIFDHAGKDDRAFEVQPVLVWIENRKPREEIVAGAAFRRELHDLNAAAAFARNCNDFMKGDRPKGD